MVPVSRPALHSVQTLLTSMLIRSMQPWAIARVQGLCCDVTSPGSVARLASVATGLLGGKIDVWINNAGYSGSFQVHNLINTVPYCTQLFVSIASLVSEECAFDLAH